MFVTHISVSGTFRLPGSEPVQVHMECIARTNIKVLTALN
jgi:hypothetical protein